MKNVKDSQAKATLLGCLKEFDSSIKELLIISERISASIDKFE